MTAQTPTFSITAIELFERPVVLRMPFRFGVVTLTACPQAFARTTIRFADGRTAVGTAAEMMAPKWFDKNLALSNDDNFDQLRDVLHLAREAYLSDASPATAFGHFARHYDAHQTMSATRGYNPLLANYGPALLDRAILDALCRAHGTSFYAAMQGNLAGIGGDAAAGLASAAGAAGSTGTTGTTVSAGGRAAGRTEFAGLDIAHFLAKLAPAASIEARHTVGLVDAITNADLKEPVNDGLPESLEQVVAHYGHRYFKLKVGGNLKADVERLTAIASVLDQSTQAYYASLDGNEQYDSAEQVAELLARMRATPALARLTASILFVEQPIARKAALDKGFGAFNLGLPVIIDESDGTLDTFVEARARGYAGVSSKTCKGLYKSVLNAARCVAWNAEQQQTHYFMSAEDLTTQAGLSVQQDLALVNLLGITHVERNGHHYVNGMAALPEAEQRAFLAAHPDVYEHSHGAVRLAIKRGRIAIASLNCDGYASAALPDFDAMHSLAKPATPT